MFYLVYYWTLRDWTWMKWTSFHLGTHTFGIEYTLFPPEILLDVFCVGKRHNGTSNNKTNICWTVNLYNSLQCLLKCLFLTRKQNTFESESSTAFKSYKKYSIFLLTIIFNDFNRTLCKNVFWYMLGPVLKLSLPILVFFFITVHKLYQSVITLLRHMSVQLLIIITTLNGMCLVTVACTELTQSKKWRLPIVWDKSWTYCHSSIWI